MLDFIWVAILALLTIISLIFFLTTLSSDMNAVKRLKKKKSSLVINFSLFAISLISLGLIIYLFLALKTQVDILS
ncbi:hypothetical protein ACWOAH_09665 [Vagococcus vulneris]|uniref:Uncharacterized protein n=1 Tax=Vagococcus vulneris TaxID=1977869 RepID=A0A429ZU49_9ENTE|nr:hypothetical protein [Vagococcus vulneris]RST97151.1 hypothetical protein CBF37_10240 [Vagococcus vulneris]